MVRPADFESPYESFASHVFDEVEKYEKGAYQASLSDLGSPWDQIRLREKELAFLELVAVCSLLKEVHDHDLIRKIVEYAEGLGLEVYERDLRVLEKPPLLAYMLLEGIWSIDWLGKLVIEKVYRGGRWNEFGMLEVVPLVTIEGYDGTYEVKVAGWRSVADGIQRLDSLAKWKP